MKTIKELEAERDALIAKKLEKEIADLSKVEVPAATTTESLNAQLKDAAKNPENQQKVMEGIIELKALAERNAREAAPKFQGKFISKEVTKHFGAEKDTVASQAEDLAHSMIPFEIAMKVTGKPIWELNRFQKMFGNIGQAGFQKLYGVIQAQHKIMDPSGESTWVATDTSQAAAMHIMKSKSASKVCSVFSAPSNPFNWPISTGYSTAAAVKGTYGTSVTAADTGVSRLVFNAQTLQRVAELADELDEDAAFSVGPFIMAQLYDALGDMLDRAVYFGDESSANPSLNINDVKAAALTTAGGYQLMDGLVKFALVTNSVNDADIAGAAALANIITVLKLMDYAAVDPSKLALSVPAAHYFKLLGLFGDESKYGMNGSHEDGSVAKVWGIPVFITGGIPLTDSTGRVDGDTPANNTDTSFVINRKDKCLLDIYRAPKSAQELYPVSGKTILGVSLRADLQITEVEAVGYGFNVSA